jgi:hypothetical protein
MAFCVFVAATDLRLAEVFFAKFGHDTRVLRNSLVRIKLLEAVRAHAFHVVGIVLQWMYEYKILNVIPTFCIFVAGADSGLADVFFREVWT